MVSELNSSGAATASFADRLLAWFAEFGRHDLPWQQQRSLYRVWVSEVMLQQTQVATVIPYFERFMSRFPTIDALAAATDDEVLQHWSGLGYYARARNLHKTARQLVTTGCDDLPTDVDALCALPGIGRSTAGAILAQALNRRHPILDGNVKRVLARWAGIAGDPGSAAVIAELWAASERVTPDAQAADFTQAIMDLGATLCTRRQPGCARCPVRTDCVAYVQGRQLELPSARQKRQRPTRIVHWLVMWDGQSLAVARRPPEGIWGGLYGFPEAADAAGIQQLAYERTGRRQPALRALVPFTHAFTHFELHIHPWLCTAEGMTLADGETWYTLGKAAEFGVPTPVATLAKRVHAELNGNG